MITTSAQQPQLCYTRSRQKRVIPALVCVSRGVSTILQGDYAMISLPSCANFGKSPSKPLLLDLFCGAGGAGTGYQRAGFHVVGVDIAPQPHYPFEFYQDDALHVLGTLTTGGCWNGYTLDKFAVLHASPECKSYTNCNLSPKENYPRLIAPVRRL